MTLRVGLSAIFAEPAVEPAERIDELVRLLTDPRWPWQPQLLGIGNAPGQPRTPPRKGKIPARELADEVRRAFASPTSTDVTLACSRLEASNHAWVRVDTGRGTSSFDRVPFEVIGHVDAEDLRAGKTIAAWLELAHEVVRAVRAVHGVVVVTGNHYHLSDELWLSTTSLNGKPTHRCGLEIQRVRRHRRELGVTYVRIARWGNCLPPFAVEAVGGRARIEEVVRPPLVREVGPLLYVQMSERAEDALSPDAEARRRALHLLLAPVVVPTA